MKIKTKFCLVVVVTCLLSCTQDTQNQLSRTFQNYTGTDGVLEVMSGGKVLYRFINIDKLSTAFASKGEKESRPYRFGYGVLDKNFNFQQDEDEQKIYFEFSDFSTEYIFYEKPRDTNGWPLINTEDLR